MLVNNAGFGSMNEFVKLDLARELEMIDLNEVAGGVDAPVFRSDAGT